VKWGLPALAALLLFYPFILTGPFYWDIGVAFLLAAISASAWNIVGGYAGQVSVGHSMFFGLGAYTPLHLASARGHTTAIARLLEAGSKVGPFTTTGVQPLHLAAGLRPGLLRDRNDSRYHGAL
jgi:branched-chain amino acid transport system permease protein